MESQSLRALTSDNSWLGGEALTDWFARFLPEPLWARDLELPAEPRKASLVVGPRQAGKSTLIWKTLREKGEPALFLNCEDPSIKQWLSSPAVFVADLSDLETGASPLFFEEVQALDNAGLFLKGLIDRHIDRPIYATGSSAFDLEAQNRESLAGRAHRHLLLPFSIAERLRAVAGNVAEKNPLTQLKRRQVSLEMAVYGGYPAVLAAPHPEGELADLAEAFVLRDVSDRFRIRHLHGFRKLVQLAASQIGNLVNFSDWASLAGISSDTVADYCRLLEEAHILRLVRPYVGGKRAEIISAPKVYFLDNGLRNQIFGGFQSLDERADRGALIENLVFSELSKVLNPVLDSIRYWRTKAGTEVDFVIEHQGRLLAIEVKAGDTRGRIGRGHRSFVEAYSPERLLMVGSGDHSSLEFGATRIDFLGVENVGSTVREWTSGERFYS